MNSEPKETMLNNESGGSDYKIYTNASFALLILLPFIDPLLSSKKMNSAFADLSSN